MLPKLNNIYKRKEQIIEFKGINRTDNRTDGELIECLNMTLDDKPTLKTRVHRTVEKDIAGISHYGFLHTESGEHFYYIKDKWFYFDNVKKGQLEKSSYRIAVMNDNIVIAPDMKVYDTMNDKFISMIASITSTSASFSTKGLIIGGAGFEEFAEGDKIKISGSTKNNGTFTIDYIGASNSLEIKETFTPEETENVTISKTSPRLDYIVEHNNRIWGCGINDIYASRQGSCTEFEVFEGLNSDSYATDVGTQGIFTGITKYGNNVMFLKENFIHVLYGDKPKNFQIVTKKVSGVKYGCERSIAEHKGYLFYQSYNDIVLFNGETIRSITKPLDRNIDTSVLYSYNDKLYCNITCNGISEMMIYDTSIREWIKEDELKVINFDNWQGNLIMNTPLKVYRIKANAVENVPYSAEIGPFDEWTDDNKAYSKLSLEVELEANANMIVSIKHDDEAYNVVANLKGDKKHFRIPIQPKRCHSFTVKVEGVGDCKIKRLVRTYRIGSDK